MFLMMCQGCGTRGKDVSHRTIRTKGYTGPCADSLCYSTCDSPSCRAIECILCGECVTKVESLGLAALGRSSTVVLEGDLQGEYKKADSVRAYFEEIKYLGHNERDIALTFVVTMSDYEKGRAIGGFVCSNVRLSLKKED